MTDPICFSSEKKLGNIDWGTKGMKDWMKNH